MSFGIATQNGLGVGLGVVATLRNAASSSAPPPPPVTGALSHTLLQIGLTTA